MFNGPFGKIVKLRMEIAVSKNKQADKFEAAQRNSGKLSLSSNWMDANDNVAPTIGHPWRVAISILVVLQVMAVLAEPLRFFSQSPVKFTSEDVRWLQMVTRPYSDFMYLSHGYSFFAPNPGPSHLLECEMVIRENEATPIRSQQKSMSAPLPREKVRDVSQKSSWYIFPDRKQDWPRLLYHRQFMLSEFYHTQFAPATLADQEKLDPNVLAQWKHDRQLYEQLQKSIKLNLEQRYPEHTSTLRRIEHALPSEYQVLVDHWKLTDPRLYLELLEGERPAPMLESMPKP